MTDQTHAATCKGVKVPHSPFLHETRIRKIEDATYEKEEIAGALSVVREGDRVLELGAGLGIVGAVTAHNTRPEAVLSFEANPNLIPHIRELHALNGLQDVIELRNEVLIASPDRPDTMTFHIAKSYLGSSLLDNERRPTTPVDIPTASFNEVMKTFRPNVLIMDIEGGELDLLEHADLTGIRAIVVEFHPDLYGKERAAVCKDILRAAGFTKKADVSSRFVWTCTRPSVVLRAPRPDAGWSTEVVNEDHAIVVPPRERNHVQEAGVLTAKGDPVAHAALWRGNRLLTQPPPMPPRAQIEDLPGRWLWGGVLWRYFPHFITESITRLWADAAQDAGLDGILFIPKNPMNDDPAPAFQKRLFELMGCDLPIRELRAPTRVEHLIVPGQGFGLGEISSGTEAFREAMRNRFAKDIAPEGGERLYISRSKLGPQRGALLGETEIEKHLAAQGYEIFHPQEHSLDAQIARYRAATHVVAAEGSALHLYAFAGRPGAKVAMILRRKSKATRHISTHISAFTGNDPIWIDTLQRSWRRVDTPRKRLHIGEPDFAALQTRLVQTGFIDAGPTWRQPAQSDVQDQLGPTYRLTTDEDVPLAG